MKLFKPDDSILDVTTRLVTIAGFIFAVYVYFDKIHPVFEKERELQTANSENLELELQKESLHTDIQKLEAHLTTLQEEKAALRAEIAGAEANLESVRSELLDTREVLEARNEHINSLLEENENAGHVAIKTHLERMSEKITAQYLQSVRNPGDVAFSLEDTVSEILTDEKNDISNTFHQQAVDYMESYSKRNLPKATGKNAVIRFAVSLPFDYEIATNQ